MVTVQIAYIVGKTLNLRHPKLDFPIGCKVTDPSVFRAGDEVVINSIIFNGGVPTDDVKGQEARKHQANITFIRNDITYHGISIQFDALAGHVKDPSKAVSVAGRQWAILYQLLHK